MSAVDCREKRYWSFEVLLEALDDSLAATTGGAVARAAGAEGSELSALLRATLHRRPELPESLLALAERLAEDNTASPPALALAAAAANALAQRRGGPEALWTALAAGVSEADGTQTAPLAAMAVLRGASAEAERQVRPPGFVDRPTGRQRLPDLLALLESAAEVEGVPATVALLRVEGLTRSLLVDGRGRELLDVLLEILQRPGPSVASPPLRAIFHSECSLTVSRALSPPFVDAVGVLPEDAATDGPAVGVLQVGEACDEFSVECPVAEAASEQVRQARFEWQMNEVLGHPSILAMRAQHAEAPAAFALVLWESIRIICRRPHLPAPRRFGDADHPVVEAMLDANLLAPRWAPTRLVLTGDETRRRLLAWLDVQHAKLSWGQRFEYSLQLVRERPGLVKRLDRLAQ